MFIHLNIVFSFIYKPNTPKRYIIGLTLDMILHFSEQSKYLRSTLCKGKAFKSLKNSVRLEFGVTKCLIITPSRLIISSILELDHTKFSLIC